MEQGKIGSENRKLLTIYTFELILLVLIDTTRQIAETLYFSLSGVDALQGEGLGCMFGSIFLRIGYNFISGVDLAAETFTG